MELYPRRQSHGSGRDIGNSVKISETIIQILQGDGSVLTRKAIQEALNKGKSGDNGSHS
jgi:hypothetical protein